MRSAYSKGFIKALTEYMIKNNIDSSDIIEFEANHAPFQPNQQKVAKDVKALQYSHSNDYIAGSKTIKGAEKQDTSSDSSQDHSISSFEEQIKTLPSGTYKVVNGKIMPNY